MYPTLEAATVRISALERELEASKKHSRALQKQNDALVQLAVASQLLGSASDRDDVLDVIEEIVINMIGSEHLAILEKPELTDAELVIARARGAGAEPSAFGRAVRAASEAIDARRTLHPGDGEVTAVVPLAIDATPLGAIVVFQLLAHKPALDAGDHALLDLLCHHAAKALFFTTAFRSMKPTIRPPRTTSDTVPLAAAPTFDTFEKENR